MKIVRSAAKQIGSSDKREKSKMERLNSLLNSLTRFQITSTTIVICLIVVAISSWSARVQQVEQIKSNYAERVVNWEERKILLADPAEILLAMTARVGEEVPSGGLFDSPGIAVETIIHEDWRGVTKVFAEHFVSRTVGERIIAEENQTLYDRLITAHMVRMKEALYDVAAAKKLLWQFEISGVPRELELLVQETVRIADSGMEACYGAQKIDDMRAAGLWGTEQQVFGWPRTIPLTPTKPCLHAPLSVVHEAGLYLARPENVELLERLRRLIPQKEDQS